MTLHAFDQEEDETLAGLQSVAGNQNAPSPTQGPPPEGALGAPASAGGNSSPQAFDSGGQDYYQMFKKATLEDQTANLDAMEESLGSQGTGVVAKTSEIASNAMAQKDGKTLNLLLKWGWKPPEERPAFDPASMGGEAQGPLEAQGPPEAMGPPEEMGPPEGLSDQQVAAEKKKFDRRQMGGFLMELGLNILASNRDDAGGAVGEAFGKTRSARTERKRVRAVESMAQSERERKIRREDEADLYKRNEEERKQRKEIRDQIKSETDNLVEMVQADGTSEYVNKKEGKVYLESGEESRKATKYDKDRSDFLSAGGRETTARANRRAIDEEIGTIKEEVAGMSEAPELKGLSESSKYAEFVEIAKARLKEHGYTGPLFEPKEKTKDYDELDY